MLSYSSDYLAMLIHLMEYWKKREQWLKKW